MTGEQLTRPVKPNPDTITRRVMKSYEFARDIGGELFLLPTASLGDAPYIPQSFFTGDVSDLCHQIYRAMAIPWNMWLAAMTEDERTAQKLKFVPEVPAEQTIRNSVSHMKALCNRTGKRVTAALRAVQVGGGIVIDLGDETGKVIWVTASGWEVMDPRKLPVDPPVFRRGNAVEPLPEPVSGGDLGELWRILRVQDAETISLCTGNMTGSYFSGVSRPGIWTTGPAGSGKTTLAGGIARVVDGLEWLDGRLDKSDERNNIIRAVTNYLVSFDNMTSVTADVSDWIATLVTGHRDTFREMRTNFNAVSMAYKRSFVATGLSMPYGFQADALERIIEIPRKAIPDAARVSDEEIRAELDRARPRILGALLDHVVAVLGWLPHIPEAEKGIARMNGYAHILWAHDKAYGNGATPCMDAYRASLERIQQDKAEGEPVIVALLKFIPPGHSWEGTNQQLHDALMLRRPHLGDFMVQRAQKDFWPDNPVALANKLTALERAMAESGLTVTRWRESRPSARKIRIYRAN